MSSLNLHAIDPAELMPLPEDPDTYGPRNEEERRIYQLIKESLDSPSKTYASVADFIAEMRATLPSNNT